jgi:two-component system sensor histidine kinase/response regulator
MKNKILIIEDDEDLRENLKEILQYNDFEVLTANNGKEALELLDKNEFDLIISDLLMPVMDGLSFMANIKKRSGLENTPFILLSGIPGIDDHRYGIEQGADDYLHKPISSQSLLKAVYGSLEKKNKRETWAKDKLELALKEDRKITFHEFRTPLSGISSIFDLMETSVDEFNKIEFLELIQIGKDSVSRINESLNKLSLFKRLGNLVPTQTMLVFDILNLRTISNKLFDKLLIENWTINDSIIFDKDLFNFLIKELISNAVKYSPIGFPIIISFDKGIFSISNHQYIINEIGIFQPEPFNQIKRSFLEQQGFGLGLFICKQIASLHKTPFICEIDHDLKFKISVEFNIYVNPL